ncbi:MAG: hypothetical protein E7408_05175 [Ruminococcaceae bacterium]|nr:hypothetical protein [Oscillospiraceae bacterium]
MPVFTNQATLTYDGNTTNSNMVTGELLAVLAASKTAVGASYRFGDRITYIIRITNGSTSALSDISVSDNLGAYCFEGSLLVPLTFATDSVLYYIDGVPQTAPTVEAGPPLAISGLSIPAGSTAMLLYEAVVNTYAPVDAGGTITNVATITGSSLPTPLEATETVSAASSASLVISKSLCPSSVTENAKLTYTFVIQNIGTTAATAADAAVITDTFDPVLSDISVLYNGETWRAPENYTYDCTNGLFATISGQITVPAATYAQDSCTGQYVMTPGVATVQITGTVVS